MLSCQTHRKACSKEHVTPEACFALRQRMRDCTPVLTMVDAEILAPTLGKRVPHGFLGMSEKPRAGKFKEALCYQASFSITIRRTLPPRSRCM